MKLPANKSIPPGGPYQNVPDNSELPGGHAGVRWREFNQGRLPESDQAEDYDQPQYWLPDEDSRGSNLDIIP